MARIWGVISSLLWSLLLASSSRTTAGMQQGNDTEISFAPGYLIMAPKVFVAETEETICMTLQNMTGPIEVAVRLLDNTTVLAEPPVQFMEFPMACYQIQVPAIVPETMEATLVVEMRRTLVTLNEFEVTEERLITISAVNSEMFIETDKPVYKPGQTVKFRIININQELKPDLSPVSKVWVESPGGVRMEQWKDVQGSNGLIDLELPMTPDPTLGKWTISALHKGRKFTKSFDVDEYVLPKFEILIAPPSFIMTNETSVSIKVCGRYTYGQPVRGSFEARITVKSEGWNSRERRTLTRRVQDTGPSGCNEFPVNVAKLELNSTDFSLWNARLSVEVDYTETSTGVTLTSSSETAKITRDALKLKFDAPSTFKPGVPYYGKIFVTYPDGSPAVGKLISLSCSTDQGEIFNKNFTSLDLGAIEFSVTDINITSTSLNLYAHAPGFNTPAPETFGRVLAYTLHDPATSLYARPQYSPSGSFLQLAPIKGAIAVGSEQTIKVDYTTYDPDEHLRFRFVVMSRGNIIPTRFYKAQKRSKRQVVDEGGLSPTGGPSSVDESPFSVDEPSPSIELGSLDIPSEIPSDLGPSSFSSSIAFVPPTDPPVDIVQPGDVYSNEISFQVTPDMVPQTRILAYYVRLDGEVVADSLAFRVQEQFVNEVEISFADEERVPGAETQLNIRASPGSLCAVGVVDKSVHILGGDNQLKADTIFSSLDRYQLNSNGGYVESSTRCEPEEDEFPQFFPLGRRKKRGIFLPGFGAKYQDSSRAFMDMGLIYITNMDVETSPCLGSPGYPRARDGALNSEQGPVPLPILAVDNIDGDDNAVLEKADLPSNVLETAPRIRSYFPETWLWDLRTTDSETGEASIVTTVPHTVTEWVGSGFCTSAEYGVGVSPPTKLTAFQPFFLSYTLPYSVIRGEVVSVVVTVFNYLTESLAVEVALEVTDDFVFADGSPPRKTVCVGGSESQPITFRIIPSKLGSISLEAVGVSVEDQDALCGNEVVTSRVGARDAIYKLLLVEAEGAEIESTTNCYLCPREAGDEFRKVFNITLPADIVEGSARGTVSITGDLMGPSLSNLDRLISLPTGCGEQNMLGFVPNIVALSYLTATDQLTPSIETKAKFNMKRGYQRELNYRHSDGSYSAFGENDPEGSTWLTAFVVRSYAQASDYVYIDDDDLGISVKWLRGLQNPETGCFESRGKLLHKGMKGGVSGERTLTSYVIITLLEAGLSYNDPAIVDGLGCVTRDLEEVDDTYTLAQLAYALTLAGSPLADKALSELDAKAVNEDGLQYWRSSRTTPADPADVYSHQAPSTDIEITSYALLAKIASSENASHALLLGNPIARWVVLQRNSNGGFSSTQDTVVALQALSEFAKVVYDEDTNIKAIMRATPLGGSEGEGEEGAEVHPFTITTYNRLVQQEAPLGLLPSQVTVYASGSGCALMQISTVHNEIPVAPEDAGFEVDTLVLEAYESSRDQRCSQYFMKVCARYTGSDDASNMAIVKVRLVSGFFPDKESLRLLQKQHEPLQRYEVDNKNIFFYFHELTNEDNCLVFTVTKEMDVEDAKPGLVQVYDYYDKDIQVTKLYDVTCDVAPPSWPASLLYTLPAKPRYGGKFSSNNNNNLRPLPFVLAALRSADGVALVEPEAGLEAHNPEAGGTGENPLEGDGGEGFSQSTGSTPGGGEESEGVSEGGVGGVDGEGDPPPPALDTMEMAMKLGRPDVFILCPSGQKFVDGLMTCVPLNGCESSPCLEGQNCIDTDAGHLCVGCKPGYRKGAANLCVRVPDPSLSFIVCGPAQEFINGACTTINQCVGDPCPVGARCRSTPFGHTCEPVFCPPGRQLTPDLQCIDIDECVYDPCGEEEVCVNTVGSYSCEPAPCPEGYARDLIQNQCVDINECESLEEPCGGPQYICVNDPGSYQCSCVEGYVIDQDGYCILEEEEEPTLSHTYPEIPPQLGQGTDQPSTAEEIPTEEPSIQDLLTTGAAVADEELATEGPIIDELVTEIALVEEFVTEEVIVDELVTEAPVVEELVTEEAGVDELVTEEVIAVTELPAAQDSVTQGSWGMVKISVDQCDLAWVPTCNWELVTKCVKLKANHEDPTQDSVTQGSWGMVKTIVFISVTWVPN